MYKTGDLVRYNSDGSMNFVMRKDTQIKLNGQRIELSEIEHYVKANLPETTEAAVVNGYGPTEAAVMAATNPIVIEIGDPLNIGRVHPGGRLWVADPTNHNRVAPVRCVGELLIEGPILAREYINNKEKTAQKFIDDLSG
jgi:non-ribosomal peptide synthetase component F